MNSEQRGPHRLLLYFCLVMAVAGGGGGDATENESRQFFKLSLLIAEMRNRTSEIWV